MNLYSSSSCCGNCGKPEKLILVLEGQEMTLVEKF